MPEVRLGNNAAQHHIPDEAGDVVATPLEGNLVTSINIPDSYTRQEALRTVWHPDGVWAQHSTAPGPAWVESDDPALAEALAAIYGCPVGRPEDWETQA